MLAVGKATEAEKTCWSLRPLRPPPLLFLPPHLQPQADPLGDGRLGEGRLHHGQQLAGEGTPLRANQVALLLHARHHGQVEREVGGDDAADALLAELLLALQVWGGRRAGRGVRRGSGGGQVGVSNLNLVLVRSGRCYSISMGAFFMV